MKSEIQNLHGSDKLDRWIFLLFLLLLFVPYGLIFQSGDNWHYYQIYAVLWVFKDWSTVHGDAAAGVGFLDFNAFVSSLFLSGFRYVFAYQIYRHRNSLTTKRRVWISALLSLIPLTPIAILSVVGVSFYAGGGFEGPIPIFLIIGLI
ncbi:MAG: hypothetical protein ACXABZ_05960, partial [Candidatus Thorarchaeota archaeon]